MKSWIVSQNPIFRDYLMRLHVATTSPDSPRWR